MMLRVFGIRSHRVRRSLALVLVTLALVVTAPLARALIRQEASRVTELQTKATALVDAIAAGDFAAAVMDFDETMKAALPAEKLREAWTSVLVSTGQYQGRAGVRTERVQTYDVVLVGLRFERATLDAKVVFDPAGRVAGLFFIPPATPLPQAQKPEGVEERDLVVGSGEWALPATLSLPAGSGPFPAVVLVHGSGPNDRDETVGANKPFRDLAWGLALRGAAVLRYEKRTREHATKLDRLANTLTVKEETVDDAVFAVQALRKVSVVDSRRIVVLGHSLGGMLVPRIAGQDSKIAGFVVLAGAARRLEDAIVEQLEYIFALDGGVSAEERAELDRARAEAAKVKNLARLGASDVVFGAPKSYWLDLDNYDAPEAAKAVGRPMLILQGGRDYQVTPAEFGRWQKALASLANVSFKVYPELNHLFIAGTGPGKPSEYATPGRVHDTVLDDIARWVKAVPAIP
jgi:dienelactone hydrolase